MYELRRWLVKEIDKVILGAGLLVGFALPAALLLQMGVPISLETPKLIADVTPALGVTMMFFLVFGLAAVIVGLRGLAGRYGSMEDRRVSLLKTMGAIGGALLLLYVVVKCCLAGVNLISSWQGTEDSSPSEDSTSAPVQFIRCAVAAIGAMAGFHLATLRPPPDERKMLWFSVLGAVAAWCLAYTVFSVLVAAALGFVVLKYIWPLLQDLSAQRRATRPRSNSPTASTGQRDSKITDLRRQVEWTQQSGAPAQFRREEIARLEAQIRQLGGSP